MKWITRERPKIDRIACPWLIKRFIDPGAEILFVPFQEVLSKAKEWDAIPFDIPGVKFTHYGDHCTFDALVEEYKIDDPAILTMARIIRGADTDRHEMADECAGLWALSAGLAHNIKNDHELLDKGMILYDALYSWAKYLQDEKHTQHPFENLLLEVFHKYISKKNEKQPKPPAWAKELKGIIQDQIDTNMNLSLQEISSDLNVHPAYLSREFSKYFDNLSYGEYLRKRRIEKAIHLLHTSSYSLSEIAYLTGFFDQSHFARVFKKHIGKNPSSYRKRLREGKTGTKT
ncbi:MAG TPA: chromate resistance protein ChrB domain-containing protein [Anseongella sp.]